MGEGVDEFNFNFKKESTKHLFPSKMKRNSERRNEYLQKKIKSEKGSNDDKTVSDADVETE